MNALKTLKNAVFLKWHTNILKDCKLLKKGKVKRFIVDFNRPLNCPFSILRTKGGKK